MRNFLLLSCVMLTACGTITVHESGSTKRIEFSNPPAIGFPPEAAFASNEVRSAMELTAMKQCPVGYKILNQGYDATKKALVWNINCN